MKLKLLVAEESPKMTHSRYLLMMYALAHFIDISQKESTDVYSKGQIAREMYEISKGHGK